MKQKSILMVLAISLFSGLAHAQIKLPSFKGLCSYESDCRKIGGMKNGELVYKKPRPELMDYYKRLRPLIIQVAAEYQVDPVTLVMAPLAENTLNVNIVDKLEDEMEREGQLDDDGAFADPVLHAMYNKPMSIGPGQIYVFAAKHVEKMAALIENRPTRKGGEIRDRLMTQEGALRYAAAILKDAQDTYAKGGVDISHRPEILATLYNIGKVTMRLNDAKGRESYPNYFGYFVGLNYAFVQHELNLPSFLGSAN